MTAPIITPALVRRYLIATGWEDAERGFIRRKAAQIGLFAAMTPYDLNHEVETIARVERVSRSDVAARLGMLAAAERLREAAAKNWAPGEDPQIENFIRGETVGLVIAAGVDPEAWEKARNT